MKLSFGPVFAVLSLIGLLVLPAVAAQAVSFQAKQVMLEHPANGKLLKLDDNPGYWYQGIMRNIAGSAPSI